MRRVLGLPTALRRIVEAVTLPVTADLEDGYGLSAEDLAERTLDAGACGLNLEDTDHTSGGLSDLGRHADWLAAVRNAAADRGYGLVINARVDVFLVDRTERPHRELLDQAVTRARSYREAGADCVFPIFLQDADTIGAFVEAVQAPVNILATPQAPSISQLAELGVARISYGSLIHSHTMQALAAFLADLAR